MKAKLQAVEVFWVDSAVTKNWDTLVGMNETSVVECRTVGYLFHLDKHVVKVVQSRYVENPGIVTRVADMMAIPRVCVRKIAAL